MANHLGEHDPWITLALAVIYQAAQDAQTGHPALALEAKRWLKIVGISWCQIVDIPENVLENWSNNSFRLSANPKRNWRY